MKQAALLFEQAVELAPEDRAEFLDRVCHHDQDLHAEVSSLLLHDQEASGFLDSIDSHSHLAEHWHGRRLGAYRITATLGSGGMGVVFLAERDSPELQQEVAIKVLVAASLNSRIARRVMREIRILSALDHPYIARFLDFGESDEGFIYLVMERVRGEMLTASCDRRQLPIADRLELFTKVCRAVEHAHRNLVVHCDLKPANILVTPGGDPRLLDFGIARLLAAEGDEEDLTAGISWLFTPRYASPEQRSGGPITTATDVYTLGVLLHELLTGQLPFDHSSGFDSSDLQHQAGFDGQRAPSPSDTVTRLDRAGRELAAKQRSTSSRDLRRTLVGDLDSIVCRALRRSPDDRYASVRALADDITRHIEGRPIATRPARLGYRLGKLIKRHRIATAAMLASLLTIAGFVANLSAQKQELAKRNAIVVQERNRAEAVTQFLTEAFRVADPGAGFGAEPSAREVIENATKVLDELDDQPRTQTKVQHILGIVYRGMGDYDESKKWLEQALSTAHSAFGSTSKPVADAHRELAVVALETGSFDQIEPHARTALELTRDVAGELDPDVAESLTLMAFAAHFSNQHRDAERRAMEAIRVYEAQPDQPQGEMRLPLTALAISRAQLGLRVEAVEAAEQNLELTRAVVGDDHPDVVAALSNLSTLQWRAGFIAQSEAHVREAIALGEDHYGSDHPHMATMLNALAQTLRRLGRTEESLKTAERSLAIREKTIPNHPFTLASRLLVSQIYLQSGQPEIAEVILLELLDHGTEGIELSTIGFAKLALARIEASRGQLDQAASRVTEAVVLFRELNGPSHPRIASSLAVLGTIARLRGQLSEAESLIREGLEMVGPDHQSPWEAAQLLAHLGATLVDQGDFVEAESIIRRSLSSSQQHFEGNPVTSWSSSILGASLAGQGRLSEAQGLLSSSYDALSNSLGPAAVETRDAQRWLEAFSKQY